MGLFSSDFVHRFAHVCGAREPSGLVQYLRVLVVGGQGVVEWTFEWCLSVGVVWVLVSFLVAQLQGSGWLACGDMLCGCFDARV